MQVGVSMAMDGRLICIGEMGEGRAVGAGTSSQRVHEGRVGGGADLLQSRADLLLWAISPA